jgi:hypothetical protein
MCRSAKPSMPGVQQVDGGCLCHHQECLAVGSAVATTNEGKTKACFLGLSDVGVYRKIEAINPLILPKKPWRGFFSRVFAAGVGGAA